MPYRCVNLEVRRDALADTRLVEEPRVEPAEGEALLEIERFGLSANNVTYAVLGDELGYWRFFPADEGWGRIPVWGFARVVMSRSEVVRVGDRLFGYCPMATHVLLTPRRSAAGVVDAAEHRASLPSAYNVYRAPDADPGYDATREAEQLVLRPLLMLCFLLDDMLASERDFAAEQVVLSSASSKTALGLAYLLSQRGVRTVALTSPRNAAFVEGLGIHDEVVTYDRLEAVPRRSTVRVDLAGDPRLRRRVHEHFGDVLGHSALVGATHHDGAAFATADPLPGPEPTFFFVPDRLRLRTREWGQAELDARMGEAWERLTDWTATWLAIEHVVGPEAAQATYREVLEGAVAPDVAHTVSLAAS